MPNLVKTHIVGDARNERDAYEAAAAPRQAAKQELGRRIYKAMIARGMTQSDLARAAGLARDAISTYVNGRSAPTPLNLKKLAAALGVEESELFPSRTEAAIAEETTSAEMKVAAAQPDRAWLRVNRLVSTDTAVEVMRLLGADKTGK